MTRNSVLIAALCAAPLSAQYQIPDHHAVVSTVMADTVRTPDVRTSAQNPPVAQGYTQGTVLLHSGELVVSHVDLDAGGRAGWNVVIDRTYRSATHGTSGLGQGWASSMTERLRPMPNGLVEYRDATGEIWTFTPGAVGGYEAPPGVMLRLSHIAASTGDAWVLSDSQARRVTFDRLGRITSRTDEFFHPFQTDKGNIIHYVYGKDGRLQYIVDPLRRETEVRWYGDTGLLASVTDWRGRTVSYHYDKHHRLIEVRLPAVEHSDGGGVPTIRYTYEEGNGSYNDALEIRGNLKSITDPSGVAENDPPQVTFLWDSAMRDRVAGEVWATGETVSYAWISETEVHETDALGQLRVYALTGKGATARIASVTEKNVDVAADLGVLPAATTARNVRQQDRVTGYDYNADGTILEVTQEGVRTTGYEWIRAGHDPGFVVKSITTSPATTASAMNTGAARAGDVMRQEFNYQQGATMGGALSAVAVNGVEFPAKAPHRSLLATSSEIDGISASTTWDQYGQPRIMTSTGGTDEGSAGAETIVHYYGYDAPEHARGEIERIEQGGLVTRYRYEPSKTTVVDPDGIITVIDYDSWRRPVAIRRSGRGLVTHERLRYDASGRVSHLIRSQSGRDITTTVDRDPMGRTRSVTVDGVGNAQGTLSTTTDYRLRDRIVTTTLPTGAVITRTLDPFGRVAREHVTTGGTPIDTTYAYDLDDNLAWASDGRVSISRSFDAHGRERQTRQPDGTITSREYDAVGHPDVVRLIAADGTTTITNVDLDFTAAGRLQSIVSSVDEARQRRTSFAWDGAGRTTAAAAEGRAARTSFDAAGRWLDTKVGEGTLAGMVETFLESAAVTPDTLPQAVTVKERSADPTGVSFAYDTNGNVIDQITGDLHWSQRFDESGNIVTTTPPKLGTTTLDRDSRGATTTEHLPSGHQSKYAYTNGGTLDNYVDPTGETAVHVTPDLIGRPTLRTYADGTTERIVWDGPRIGEITDRQNRRQKFVYNERGQVTEVQRADGTAIDRYGYDEAGRLSKHTTRDASIEYLDHNAAGNPRRTVMTRFRSGTGLDPSPEILGTFVQTHEWNEHGERTGWTMPVHQEVASTGQWTRAIKQDYDALGNLESITRSLDGETFTPLLDARYRNAGRPETRTLNTSCVAPCTPSTIERIYSYDQSTRMDGVTVRAGSLDVAGSKITSFRGLLVGTATKLGTSAPERTWSYDNRGRVESTTLARPVDEVLDPAEYREAVERVPRLSETDRQRLLSAGMNPERIDPSSIVMPKSDEGAHKIGSVVQGTDVREMQWSGAERESDGRFDYGWNEKGMLVSATEAVRDPAQQVRLRVRYEWDGNHRMTGRLVETSSSTAPDEWQLASVQYLTDGLPADTTFVWDPITDTIAAMYDGTTGALVRQIIHGGLGYDDPIEIAMVDPYAPAGPLLRVYPVFDEAGNGNLQAVLSASGDLIARADQADPYGADRSVLVGPAVEKIALRAAKSEAGQLTHIDLEIRLTEVVDPASVVKGVRMVATDAAGSTLRTSTNPAELSGPFTMRLRFSAAEWAAFTEDAATLTSAVTAETRGAAWSQSQPILPAPEWTVILGRATSTADHPVQVRDTLAGLSAWLSTIPAATETENVLYQVEDPALLATGTESESIIRFLNISPFQALPYLDPITNHSLARRRWLDHTTGTFLTPDPLGFVDSPNLYAYAGGDPVNGRDPRGESYWEQRSREIVSTLQEADFEMWHPERARLLAELRNLLEDRNESPPDEERGVVDQLMRTFFSDWGTEARSKWEDLLDVGYRSTYRAPELGEIVEIYGGVDRGKQLQDATYRDVGGAAVEVAVDAAQTELQLGAVRAIGVAGTYQIARSARAERLKSLLQLYPQVLDMRTGRQVPFPSGVGRRVHAGSRAAWGPMERSEYIREWYRRGYTTPAGGWSQYDIHHILPREYGGGNEFWNLTPVLRKVHVQEFNTFWRQFGGL